MPAPKGAAALYAEINKHVNFNSLIADQVIRHCDSEAKRMGRPVDPFAEFIVPEHLSGAAYAAWHTDEARDYFTSHASAPKRVKRSSAPWECDDELEAVEAACEVMGRYFIVTEENGVTLYKIVDTARRIVEPCPPVNTNAQVSQAVKHELHQIGLAASSERSRSLLDLYLSNTTLAPRPKLWASPDEDTWCLSRATVRPDPSVPFPHIQGFLDRLNDPQACAAYIWGLYSGAYKGRQILYVSDTEGENGKSSFFRAVLALFGEQVTASLNWRIVSGSTHASAHFTGKKVVIIGDNKNPAILMSQSMKELSGDDLTMINPKGLPAYSTYLECRPIVSGNCEPLITSERHNRSRTLWLKLAPLQVAARDPEWVTHYPAEMPGFLAYGARCYAERCVNDYEIAVNPVVQAAVTLKIMETESEFAVPFDEHLVADPEGRLTDKAWQRLVREELHLDKGHAANFLSWIERTFPQAHKTQQRDGRGWQITGIRLKKAREKSGGVDASMSPGPKSYAGQGHVIMPSLLAGPRH